MTVTRDGAAPPSPARTYGNWRQRRGYGLGRLTSTQTWMALAAIVPPLVALLLSVPALLATLPVTAVGLAVALGRWDGIPLADALRARVRWRIARARGWTDYQGGVLAEFPRRHDLPGVLAPLVLLDAEDGRGNRQGMIWDRRSGTLTSVLRLASIGTMLADQLDADTWVANWGQWLADLGYVPMARWVAVTVETTPSPGTTLADHVARRVTPTAPPAARQLVADLVATAPQAAADVDTRISITLDPARAIPRPTTILEAVAEATRTLAGLEHALAGCGVALLGRASAGWLAGTVRAAFDPAVRADVARLSDEEVLLAWREAGPVAQHVEWDFFRHDSGYSVSYALHEAPRQAVPAHVLAPLLAPGPFARRVTIAYQPYAAADAARQAQAELNAATFRRAYRRRARQDDSARDLADEVRAERAALEEAEGAGVALFTVYVTTTVAHPEQLPAAAADLEQRAGAAKLRLRRCYGAQDVGFASTLGVGVYPPDLARRPHRTR